MQPIQLFWLETTEAELAADETWLSAGETACMRERWVPKRRRDWLLGRWTAKCALARYLGIALDAPTFRSLSILPAQSGVPVASRHGEPLDLSLSISHSHQRALAVITRNASVGCDIETSEPRTRAFIESFFTTKEIEQVERSRVRAWRGMESLIWSAKESVLKVLGEGLRVDTRDLSIVIKDAEQTGETWQPFSALIEKDGRSIDGWWRHDSDWFKTMASSATSATPFALPSY